MSYSFWITVAASKHVRLDPLDPNNLVQPLGAQRDDDDSEEEVLLFPKKNHNTKT